MANRIDSSVIAAILGIFSLSTLGEAASAREIDTDRDAPQIEEPSVHQTPSTPAAETSGSTSGQSGHHSGHHRGDSIDPGEEGG